MNKIGLVIQREYVTRVRKKSFLIMSLIGPILFGSLFALQFLFASMDNEQKIVEVIDESGYFKDKFEGTGGIIFSYPDNDLDAAKDELKSGDYYGLLYIPDINLEDPKDITFFAEKNPSIEIQSSLEWFIKNEIEEIKLGKSGIDKNRLDEIKTQVDLNVINITDKGEKEGDVIVALIAGYASALLIYFFIFLYGVQTLRGVIEEKTSRIVEIIISSLKPFQLMLGKIIGIGAVGLTQFIIWVVLTIFIYQGALTFYNIDLSKSKQREIAQTVQGISQDEEVGGGEQELPVIFEKISTVNFPLLLGTFLFFFLSGFLFYGALFAAVGSAVDNDSDAQQFQLPITMPLILSIMMLSAIIRDPHGSLAFWASIIPFTSPVVMMMRIPFDPPAWHIALSAVCMIGGILFTTWLAGRIYRVGILMHGTKVNYKVLYKWFMMKN